VDLPVRRPGRTGTDVTIIGLGGEGVLRTADRGIGTVAMKVYLRGFAAQIAISNLALFYRYALSHPVATAVIGCDSVEQLEENISFAASFAPLTDDERSLLAERLSPVARRLMYYKP
jgi:hypothetical protein